MRDSGDIDPRPGKHAIAPRTLFLTVTVFWTYACLSTVAQWELMHQALPHVPMSRTPENTLTGVLLYPLLLALTLVSYRIGYNLRRWYAVVPAHLALALLFGLFARPALIVSTAIVCDRPLAETFARMDGPDPGKAVRLYAAMAVDDAMNYLVLQGIVAGLTFYGRYRQEQRLRERLAAQYDRARLNALRMQISPHFLYNTLSAIAGLVRANPAAAEGMVTRLGELFRRALGERDTELVRLEREIDYAENYLEIQRMRFEGRLTYAISVDPRASGAAIPPLLLQPLLENAVEHGLRASEGAVAIELLCHVEAGRVRISISNQSEGTPVEQPATRERRGLGLANVRERLEAAYGGAAGFSFGYARPGRFEVKMSFPLRRAEMEPAAKEAAA